MTVVIVGSVEARWVAELGDALRERRRNVLVLDNLAVIGLLVLSRRIAAVVVNERVAPAGWVNARARLTQISPFTRIVHVAAEDRESLALAAKACEGPS